jgi:diguanylate cyclase (GGDEF)-like protein
MSYSRRLFAALVVALLIVAITGAVALRTHDQLVASAHLVAHTHEIIEQLDALLVDMVDAETGQRGFVITGEERYLEPFRRATDRLQGDVATLDGLIAEESLREQLTELVTLVDRKIALSREIIALRRTGGFAPAADMVANDQGKETMDEIRRVVAAMRGRERELLAERSALAEDAALVADRVFVGGAVVSALIIAGVFLFLWREARARTNGERELRRHAAISDGILTSMADGVIVADLDGRIILLNPTAERLLGRNVENTRDGIERSRLVVYRADGTTPYEQDEIPVARAIRGESIDGVECVAHLPGRADPIWFSVSARPLKASDGSRLGGVSVFRDVTEAKRAALALEERNESLHDSVAELERRNDEISLLGELSGLLQACVSEEEASSIIARSLARLFPDSCGAVYALNPSRDLVFASALWGELALAEQTFAPDACWALRRGRVHALDSRRLGLRCGHVAADVKSSICLPLMAQGEALGVLHVRGSCFADRGSATDPAPRMLHAVADEVGLALANLRLRDSLRQQSIRDPLTNLFNRRYMEESLERELQRAARKGATIGVLMIDVDHFKGFNDSYGHDAGDALLCELGATFKSSIRGEDLACRYGGEEFVVILPDTALDEAVRRAELLRTKAKGLVVHHQDRSLRTVTVSIGAAVFPEHGGDGKTVLLAADRALYVAKSEGRDRVVIASGSSVATPHTAA